MVTAVVTPPEGYEPGTPSTAVVTILDNDSETPPPIPDPADSVWSATMTVADVDGRLGYWVDRDGADDMDGMLSHDTFSWGGVTATGSKTFCTTRSPAMSTSISTTRSRIPIA